MTRRSGTASRAREARPVWGSHVRRGNLYQLRKPGDDPKRSCVFVVVSRPAVVSSRFSTVICAPVHSQRRGLTTEVEVGPDEGLKHASAILCDGLVSLLKSSLTDYVGTLSAPKLEALAVALRIALYVE
jgi:mRNA interferase MazF